MIITILMGSMISAIFKSSAAQFIESIIPGDDSLFWPILEFSVSLVIIIWVLTRIFRKKEEVEEKKEIEGNTIRFILSGTFFAIMSFTDPTYYGVILIGSETDSFIVSALLVLIWFLISQVALVIAYGSIEMNALPKFENTIEKFKNRHKRKLTITINVLLIVIAILLFIDPLAYLLIGEYLL
jgi:hypothetical protein